MMTTDPEIDAIPVKEQDVRMIILSFLIHNGYTESAKALMKGMGIDFESLFNNCSSSTSPSSSSSSSSSSASSSSTSNDTSASSTSVTTSSTSSSTSSMLVEPSSSSASPKHHSKKSKIDDNNNASNESNNGSEMEPTHAAAAATAASSSGAKDDEDDENDEEAVKDRKKTSKSSSSSSSKSKKHSDSVPMDTSTSSTITASTSMTSSSSEFNDDDNEVNANDPSANAFAVSHLPAFKSMKERKAICEKILLGQIKEAFDECQSLYPGLFDLEKKEKMSRERLRVLFLLQSQQYLEYIRNKQESEAFTILQNELGFFAFIDQSSYLDQLQDLAPLLAYTKPSTSPVGQLLLVDRRELVSNALNAAILDYLGAPMHDALANIIRQLTVAWELLIKEKIVHKQKTWSLADFMKIPPPPSSVDVNRFR